MGFAFDPVPWVDEIDLERLLPLLQFYRPSLRISLRTPRNARNASSELEAGFQPRFGRRRSFLSSNSHFRVLSPYGGKCSRLLRVLSSQIHEAFYENLYFHHCLSKHAQRRLGGVSAWAGIGFDALQLGLTYESKCQS